MTDRLPNLTRPEPAVLATRSTEGAGPTLVMLHGVFMDSSLWDAVVTQLPDSPSVRVDMPSHGASPDMPRGASLDDHVASVAATLDHQGVRGALVVGHSWGGMVGLRMAHERPDLVSGLVVSNTPLLRLRGYSRVGFHVQRMLLGVGLPTGLYGRLAAGALIGTSRRAGHPEDVTAMSDRTRRMGRKRLRETLRSVLLEPDDGIDLLPGLSVPWVAVAGQDDYVLGGGVRQRLERSGHLTVAAGGHTTALEDPNALVSAIRQLLPAVEFTAVR